MDDAAIQVPGQQPFLSYLNLNLGLCVTYPAHWLKQEGPIATGFAVVFNSPAEGPSDRFSENVNVFAEPLPPSVTLDQYYQGCAQGANQQAVKFLERGPATISGRPAYRHVYTGAAPAFLPVPAALSLQCLQYFIVSNSKGYVVTYTAESQKYNKFLPTVEQMLSTLQVK
jgi:eukaryotic-like serine/threonine-protein kinase